MSPPLHRVHMLHLRFTAWYLTVVVLPKSSLLNGIPGVTSKKIILRYYWARPCQRCQESKIHRHISAPLGSFLSPDPRFAHLHLDIVGPLPPSQNFSTKSLHNHRPFHSLACRYSVPRNPHRFNRGRFCQISVFHSSQQPTVDHSWNLQFFPSPHLPTEFKAITSPPTIPSPTV